MTAQERKNDDASCLLCVFTSNRHEHTCTDPHKAKPMRYGFAMATALTTTGMSGDFPSVYINHHGNSLSPCVRTHMDSGQSSVVCESQRLRVGVSGSCKLLNPCVYYCVCMINLKVKKKRGVAYL